MPTRKGDEAVRSPAISTNDRPSLFKVYMEMLRRLLHWGPIMATGVILSVTYNTLQVTAQWLPPLSSSGAFINFVVFALLVGLTLYNFLNALLFGPGYLPKGWKPANVEDCRFLQFCSVCEGFKAPRAHHCRKCNRCVMKMDHHCPWINNCCGHFNHAYFTSFLFFAIIGSLQGAVLLGVGLYRALNFKWYLYNGNGRDFVYLSIYELIFTIFNVGLAIGVVIAVGGLFFIQMKSILKNETNIESWIVTKAISRPREEDGVFVYPYNLGRWENFKEVFVNPSPNGIEWTVRRGCDQYTLTKEQLTQKVDKGARSRRYSIVQNYNGAFFPLGRGLRICFNIPCTDDPRLPLSIGDAVRVTRWKKHWLYGERLRECTQDRQKGWFPRACAIEFTAPDCSIDKVLKKRE